MLKIALTMDVEGYFIECKKQRIDFVTLNFISRDYRTRLGGRR